MVEFFAGFPHTFFSIVRKAAGSSTLPGRELFDFLTCKSLFDAGRRIVWIDPTNDRDTMKAAQNAVRKELADGAIAVEVNPSSNMLVGNLTELDHHPLWKLRPPPVDAWGTKAAASKSNRYWSRRVGTPKLDREF